MAHYAEDSNPVPSGKPPSNPSRAQPQRRLPRTRGRYPGTNLSCTGQPAGSFRPCVRRPAHASVAAGRPELNCPVLLGEFPTDSALVYNNRPTSPPTGIAESFLIELSGCRSGMYVYRRARLQNRRRPIRLKCPGASGCPSGMIHDLKPGVELLAGALPRIRVVVQDGPKRRTRVRLGRGHCCPPQGIARTDFVKMLVRQHTGQNVNSPPAQKNAGRRAGRHFDGNYQQCRPRRPQA